jgi:hypothetical protein
LFFFIDNSYKKTFHATFLAARFADTFALPAATRGTMGTIGTTTGATTGATVFHSPLLLFELLSTLADGTLATFAILATFTFFPVSQKKNLI